MDRHEFDIVVVGAGIAGAAASAWLAEGRCVAVLEAEEAAGYHTTGRSAAIWLRNYGPEDVRELSALSEPFLTAPPAGFAEAALIERRGAIYLAASGQEAALAEMLATARGMREIGLAEARALVPAIRPEAAVAAALEDGAADIDVAALHQGFLRMMRRAGGTLALGRRVTAIARRSGAWEVAAGDAVFAAPVLVNAAGAWGDEVAKLAGVAPLGLRPLRRTACIVDPAPWDVAAWPMVHDMSDSWYCRPEAQTRLMVSPADETPSFPHDVQPEEIDVAIGIDNMQGMLDIPVRRVERSWAGLRTFTPDGSLAIGFDARADGFFWCVGQGGYGIQTAAAAGRLAADLVTGRGGGALAGRIDPGRFAR